MILSADYLDIDIYNNPATKLLSHLIVIKHHSRFPISLISNS